MENTSNPKKSTKIILIAIFIVIIVAAVLIGAFYSRSPHPSPQEPNVVTNFSDGAWANYTLSIYNTNGTVASTGNMMTHTCVGTYNESDCWIYVENTTYTSSDGSIITDVVTDYLDKSTYTTLHKSEHVTSNGEVIYDEAFSPGDIGFMNTIVTVQNMTVTATDKSVTTPAGTFSTTERQGSITYASDPTTYDITSWASKDVPTWGVVKYQFHLSGVLFSEYTLETFGS